MDTLSWVFIIVWSSGSLIGFWLMFKEEREYNAIPVYEAAGMLLFSLLFWPLIIGSCEIPKKGP